MNVVVDGLMTNYQKVGKGKVILCLPGWADTAASFSKLAELLQDKYQLLILDLPGFGGTQLPPNAWGLVDYADFIGKWLKKIDQKHLAAIIGHSYGGAVAITALNKGDIKADKLVLLASAGVRDKRQIQKTTLKIVGMIAKAPLVLLPTRTRQKIRRTVYGKLGSDMLLLPHMEQTYKRIIGEDVQGSARSLKQPTLLIYGNKDRDTPVTDGRTLSQAITGSKLEVINAGHFLHQEQVDSVGQLIKDFLADE